jgi:hypothetical protein
MNNMNHSFNRGCKSIIFTPCVLAIVFVSLICDTTALLSQEVSGNYENSAPQGQLRIHQPEVVTRMLDTYLLQNAARPGMQGFRVRIFYDLGQQSRTNSVEIQNQFLESHSGMPIYRTFDSPYYKVSVGDFRTRDEALKFLKSITKQYPKAFVVSEWINFPPLN